MLVPSSPSPQLQNEEEDTEETSALDNASDTEQYGDDDEDGDYRHWIIITIVIIS